MDLKNTEGLETKEATTVAQSKENKNLMREIFLKRY